GVDGEPLFGGCHAAGGADPEHERIGLLEPMLATGRTQVAVVLLVGTVGFQPVLGFLGQRSGGKVGDAFRDRAAEVVGTELDAFVGGELFLTHGWWVAEGSAAVACWRRRSSGSAVVGNWMGRNPEIGTVFSRRPSGSVWIS